MLSSSSVDRIQTLQRPCSTDRLSRSPARAAIAGQQDRSDTLSVVQASGGCFRGCRFGIEGHDAGARVHHDIELEPVKHAWPEQRRPLGARHVELAGSVIDPCARPRATAGQVHDLRQDGRLHGPLGWRGEQLRDAVSRAS